MPLVGPTPLFHGHPIVVIFDPAIALPTARLVLGGVGDLVQQLGRTDATIEELTTAVVTLVADRGFLARVVARTRESVEFFVSPLPAIVRNDADEADDVGDSDTRQARPVA